jgi:hypothetical protein
MHIRDDHPQVHKGLAVKQPQMQQIFKARLLHESKKSGIIDVPLRVKVSVTYLNWYFEFKGWHSPIIQQALANNGFLIYTYIRTNFRFFIQEEQSNADH